MRRAEAAELGWPLPDGLDDTAREQRLYPVTGEGSPRSAIEQELAKRGVTLLLLRQEYMAAHPDGCSYTRFCELHNRWRGQLAPTMRQTHLAGDKLFVDWAGQSIGVVDPQTGAVHQARIFVAALGASNFTYAEARWTETLPDWIGAHVNALAAIGGVPKALVPATAQLLLLPCAAGL